MKVIELQRVGQPLSTCLEQAQKEKVLITRNGAPTALITGVVGYDLEDIINANSPTFWEMIEERRKQATINRAELERRLRDAG
ncbi:MAG: hypothetical protein CO095_18245 [Armatimonadetes bacterium CG_4_9_14_3_um_filter_58_7]|nr:MAG: hypothetical protein CO095_18245 [Armatimonadetes bacterium CG_4_9_14_3_um_filter_58_7]